MEGAMPYVYIGERKIKTSTCPHQRKKGFSRRKDADSFAALSARPMYSYLCPFCKKWHNATDRKKVPNDRPAA
jgi:hypothetical protein